MYNETKKDCHSNKIVYFCKNFSTLQFCIKTNIFLSAYLRSMHWYVPFLCTGVILKVFLLNLSRYVRLYLQYLHVYTYFIQCFYSHITVVIFYRTQLKCVGSLTHRNIYNKGTIKKD